METKPLFERLEKLKIKPTHEKTNSLHMRKTKTQISFAVTLISTFVFPTWIVQFIYFLNPKFPAFSYLLCLYSLVCVGPVQTPHCCFSHEVAELLLASPLCPGSFRIFHRAYMHTGQNECTNMRATVKTGHFFMQMLINKLQSLSIKSC